MERERERERKLISVHDALRPLRPPGLLAYPAGLLHSPDGAALSVNNYNNHKQQT